MAYHTAKCDLRFDEMLDTTIPYLLIDGVVTAGATIKYTLQSLCVASAWEVRTDAIARQPLD